jgi:hypothetical protein
MTETHISKKRVLYSMPGMADVSVVREGEIDLYFPPASERRTRTPAVVLITGFADAGARRMLGCTFNEMGAFVSWAELLAASGMVAVTYKNTDPIAEPYAVLRYIREHATRLGIDAERIAIWACSGHGPNALSVLMQEGPAIKCAALLYPYTLDLDGSTIVADVSAQFRFATPAAGRTPADLPADLPLFLGRAGRDEMPRLNEALDRFAAAALAQNLPLTLVNHAGGRHAFELDDDSEDAHAFVRAVLAFLQFHLRQ